MCLSRIDSNPGAPGNESDGYVPTGERKQEAFCVEIRRKSGHWVWDKRKKQTNKKQTKQKIEPFFWCELSKVGGHWV